MVVGNESADEGIEKIKRDADEDAGDYFFHCCSSDKCQKKDAIDEESHHSASHYKMIFLNPSAAYTGMKEASLKKY
jgi:hypothetical protein